MPLSSSSSFIHLAPATVVTGSTRNPVRRAFPIQRERRESPKGSCILN